MGSTADREPDFGPELPLYPQVEQTIRVAAPAVAGTNPKAYPSYTQQWVAPLSLRDREPCYLVEPNGIALVSGYYTARLVGSLFGLPLFVTHCCPVTASGSSSSSSGSSLTADATVTAAFTQATGCFTTLPATINLTRQPGNLFGGQGPYHYALSGSVSGCGNWTGALSGIDFNFFGTPYWIFDDGTHTGPAAVAQDGWSLSPFSCKFLVENAATGDSVLITVTGP